MTEHHPEHPRPWTPYDISMIGRLWTWMPCMPICPALLVARHSKATLAKAVAHSICVGAYCGAKAGRLRPRMVTDRAFTFAYLADVYVEPHRGRGLAQRLIKALLAEPGFRRACGA